MSTDIEYKGETIATVESDTVTLKTAGKYLEDDITVTDTSSGGGTNLVNIELDENDLPYIDATLAEIDAMYYSDEGFAYRSDYASVLIQQDKNQGMYTIVEDKFFMAYQSVLVGVPDLAAETPTYNFYVVYAGIDGDNNDIKAKELVGTYAEVANT